MIKMLLRWRIVVYPALLLIALAACGKPGSTIAPPGSPYPRYYPDPASTLPPKPNADDAATLPPEQPANKPLFSKEGSYIDPSVRATQLATPALQPGSNLPYTREQGDSALGPNLGQPNQSPLPPLDSMRPDDGNTNP